MILYVIVCATLCTAKWRLAMNLNPSDNGNLHFCTAWHRDVDKGSSTNALKNDFIDKNVRLLPINYIAIVRHNISTTYPDAVKLCGGLNKTPNISLLSRFEDSKSSVVTEGGDIYREILSHDPEDDPIFTVDGDIVLNYRNVKHGIRLIISSALINNTSDDMLPGLGIHHNLCDSCDKIYGCGNNGYEALRKGKRRLETNKNYAFFVSQNYPTSFPMSIPLKTKVKGISCFC